MSRIDSILNRKMSRREFLGTIGLGLLALFGLSSLMGILSHGDKPKIGSPGYGVNLYGGAHDKG